MRNGLWPTTIWVWNQPNVEALIAQLQRVPGEKGVIVKAADGRHVWRQWQQGLVERFHAAGIGCGLWVFQYGRGVATYEGGLTERPGVLAELAALDTAMNRATPDAVVLNIEDQVMKSPGPFADVEALVRGATERCGPVGLSTVWHWADSMGWPFAAAVRGGLAYWSNQVYGRDWSSYRNYQRLKLAHGGGLPDFISLSASQARAGMEQDGEWAARMQAPGVAWWENAELFRDLNRWVAVQRVGDAMSDRDPADVAFDAYHAQHPELGEKKTPGAGRLFDRDWGGDKISCYEGGVLSYSKATGLVTDITARVIDDFRTYALLDGSLQLYS